MAAKRRIHTNGTQKGNSFAARYKKEVKRLLDFVKELQGAEYTFELFLDKNWQFVARIERSTGQGYPSYSGNSIQSPEHAIEVLGREVATAMKKRSIENVRSIARHNPKLGRDVEALLRTHGML
jgi:hypothetical protein